MSRKKKKDTNLNKVLSNLIESKIINLFKKQTPHLKETVSEMKKSIKNLEKKLSKISTVKRAKRKSKKKTKSKPVRNTRTKNKKTCKIKGCNELRRAKGLCNKHYVAALRKKSK